MKRCRFQRWWPIPAGLLLAPLLLWLAIVIAAPTDWARTRFAAAIEASTGRSVRLDRLGVCLFGGLRLTNLEIGAPRAVDDPWFRAGEITMDLSPLSVIRGHLKPGQLDVFDASLRILRRPDGTLELSDLVKPAGLARTRSVDEPDCCALGTCLAGAHRLKVGIHRAVVTVIDQGTDARYELQEVEGEATLEGRSGGNLSISGTLNGGPFQLSGQFDRTMREPRFDVQFLASDVALTSEVRGLHYLIPVLAGERATLEGKLAGQVSLQARGVDANSLGKSVKGKGAITLDPVRLEGSSLLDGLCKLAELPPAKVSESIRSQFSIQDRRITTSSSTVQVGSVPLKLSGWTDFDGAIDYRVDFEAVTGRIPDRALRFLREIDLNVEKLAVVQLSGTLDHLEVRLDGESPNPADLGDRPRPRDDKERLRQLGRKFLDKLVR